MPATLSVQPTVPTWVMCTLTASALVLTSFAAGYYTREWLPVQCANDEGTTGGADGADGGDDTAAGGSAAADVVGEEEPRTQEEVLCEVIN